MKQLLMSIMLVLVLVSCGIGSNEMTTDRAYKSLLGFTLTDPDFLEYDKGRSMGEVTGIIETSENKIEILFTVLNVPCDYMCNPDKWRQASNGKALAFSTTEGKWILDCIQYENYYGSLMLGRQSCNLNRDMDEMAKGAISSTGNEAVVDANAGNDELAPQGEVDTNAENDYLVRQATHRAKVIEELRKVTPILKSTLPWGILSVDGRSQQKFCGGHHHGLAVKSDETVVAWGHNDLGQTNVPSGLKNVAGVYCVGDTSYAVSYDGRVKVAWGGNQSGIRDVPAELKNKPAYPILGVYKIIGSKNWNENYSYAIALTRNGTLVGWGDNTYGVLNIPTGLNDVVDISGGFRHVIALKSDGTLVGWGTDNYVGNQTNLSPLSTITGVTAISTGYAHSMARIWDGTVIMWGNNDHGQTSVPNGLTDVGQIFTGMWYSIALKNDGTVVGWGYDEYGQLSVTDLVGVTEISGTPSTSFMLLADGNLVGRGHNGFGEIPVGISIRQSDVGISIRQSDKWVGSDGENLAFYPTSLTAKAGTKVSITFKNNSTALSHNFVLVNGGDDVAAMVDEAASEAGEAAGYMPADKANIIAGSALLAPGASEILEFTAPAAGTYTYICTYPAHFGGGMYGTLTVK